MSASCGRTRSPRPCPELHPPSRAPRGERGAPAGPRLGSVGDVRHRAATSRGSPRPAPARRDRRAIESRLCPRHSSRTPARASHPPPTAGSSWTSGTPQWMTAETARTGRQFGLPFRKPGIRVPTAGVKFRSWSRASRTASTTPRIEQEAFLVLSGECRLLVDGDDGSFGRGTSSTVPPGPSTSSWAPATGRA